MWLNVSREVGQKNVMKIQGGSFYWRKIWRPTVVRDPEVMASEAKCP